MLLDRGIQRKQAVVPELAYDARCTMHDARNEDADCMSQHSISLSDSF